MRNLKNILDGFYKEYDFKGRLRHDPIQFPHRYTQHGDIETAGFIASAFAYGQVGLFSPVIEKVLIPGGDHPTGFFTSFNLKRHSSLFKGVSYRFNKEKDIICFLYMLGRALRKWGSLQDLFCHHYKDDHEDIKTALNGFVDYFLGIDTSPVYGENIKPYGLKQLFPSPSKGSTCKRMNLYLRWMVRKRDIDFGIWDRIPSSKLVIPLDTHIAKISRCLGLSKRKSPDWKTAKEITESLKRFDQEDPLKYDFALCHQGISGLCKGEKTPLICASCLFNSGS